MISSINKKGKKHTIQSTFQNSSQDEQTFQSTSKKQNSTKNSKRLDITEKTLFFTSTLILLEKIPKSGSERVKSKLYSIISSILPTRTRQQIRTFYKHFKSKSIKNNVSCKQLIKNQIKKLKLTIIQIKSNAQKIIQKVKAQNYKMSPKDLKQFLISYEQNFQDNLREIFQENYQQALNTPVKDQSIPNQEFDNFLDEVLNLNIYGNQKSQFDI